VTEYSELCETPHGGFLGYSKVVLLRRNAVKKHLVAVLTRAMALGILMVGSTVQAQGQQSIGIKFNGGGGPGGNPPPMDPSEVAGVVPQANWNNAMGAVAFNVGPLVDQSGVAIAGTSLAYGSANTWSTDVPDAPGDSRLMGGYLDSTNTSFTFVSVVGLSGWTSGPYDVYIYANGDAHGGRHAFYIINGIPPLTELILECTDFAAFDPAVGYVEDKQDGNGGNFIHFAGMTASNFYLLATPQNPKDPADNGTRAPVNAIQFVARQ
jgi:hypothetical protein